LTPQPGERAATAKVTNTKTGVVETVTTNQSGYFSVPGLIPGTYSVAVTAQGFGTVTQNLTLEVNEMAKADFSLQPGVVTQTVNVSSEGTPLNTETSTVGHAPASPVSR
jgi:Carboxypeptidase regulatory-like domain